MSELTPEELRKIIAAKKAKKLNIPQPVPFEEEAVSYKAYNRAVLKAAGLDVKDHDAVRRWVESKHENFAFFNVNEYQVEVFFDVES